MADFFPPASNILCWQYLNTHADSVPPTLCATHRSERKDFTTSESSQDTTDRLFNFEAVRQRILTEGLETTREYLALQEHEEEKGSDMIQQARNNMT